jgi:D-glycero-alpha-D-manno-heptose-7-phosphate kinase
MPRNAHPSGTIIKEHMKNFSGANARSVDAALKAKEFAVQSADALLAGNIKKFAELLDENWKVKKQFSTLVSNSAIDAFYEELKKQGAWGGKLLGAGGGGHMLVCSSPLDKTRIVNRATELGAHYIDFTFTFDGLTVWSKENHPELV